MIPCHFINTMYAISGTQLNELKTKSAVRSNGFSYGGHMIFYTTDRAMGQPCELLVYDTRDEYQISKLQNFKTPLLLKPLLFIHMFNLVLQFHRFCQIITLCVVAVCCLADELECVEDRALPSLKNGSSAVVTSSDEWKIKEAVTCPYKLHITACFGLPFVLSFHRG